MINSLYIHIPFCRRKCLYCDFYSKVYDAALSSEYGDAIRGVMAKLDGRFGTIYVGGGTPTVLGAAPLERLLKCLGGRMGDGCEYTVEANPESLDDGKLALMMDMGVNRLSVGVQSLDDRKLKKLGRLHDASRARAALAAAAKRGFDNISADLIFGVWGEEEASWKDELEEAARLPVKHISCYSLSYEKGTPLFAALGNNSVIPLGDETVARMYETAIETLALRGFGQYEVSSFARDGYRCRHNLGYWENEPYAGIGASAVSYIDGVRATSVSDVAEYIRRCRERRPVEASSERLAPARRARETAAVKIRTKDGIDFEWFRQKTGYDFLRLEAKAVRRLMDDGLIRYKREGSAPPSGIELKRKGFLFCDTVSSALL
jgi:oxygen-independent coproporphyrinogen-3 oxidase